MLEMIPRKVQYVILAAIGVVLFFSGLKYHQARLALDWDDESIEVQIIEPSADGAPAESADLSEPDLPVLVSVHVVGEVEKPGVYTLEEGNRVDEAVRLAVPTDKADLSQINLALALQDGKQIYVPARDENPNPQTGSSSGSSRPVENFAAVAKDCGKININTALSVELDKLSGIGPALAGRIIAYRENHGPFKDIEEITKVSGIGPALLAKIKDSITVE